MVQALGATKTEEVGMKFIILFLLCSVCFGVEKNGTSAKGILVLDIEGKPQIERRGGAPSENKMSTLNPKERLLGSFVIKTDDKSTVLLELSAAATLRIYPNSIVDFPLVRWESGDLDQIIFQQGRIRWASETPSAITLKSDLFELKPPSGQFVFIYQPWLPQIEVMSLKGDISFSELNGEESHVLKTGQKMNFTGRIEEGEIVYDLLLKGRRIPKGEMSAVSSLSPLEEKFYSIEEENKARAERLKKQEIVKKPKIKRKGEICSDPGGLFNECSWVCVNNPTKYDLHKGKCRSDLSRVKCVRRRCNANGKWADRYELPTPSAAQLRCKAEPVLGPCDY